MIRVCRHCSREFELRPGKPGYADECPEHSSPDVEKLGMYVEWAQTGPSRYDRERVCEEIELIEDVRARLRRRR